MLVPPLDMKIGKHTAHAKGMDIKSTNSFDYRWRVPDDHPYGVYWYHPHPHSETEDQVLGGMSGLLIIEGFIENHYPKLASAKRRTLALKDLELPGSDDDTPKISAPIPISTWRSTVTSSGCSHSTAMRSPSRAKPTTSSCRPHRERRSPS